MPVWRSRSQFSDPWVHARESFRRHHLLDADRSFNRGFRVPVKRFSSQPKAPGNVGPGSGERVPSRGITRRDVLRPIRATRSIGAEQEPAWRAVGDRRGRGPPIRRTPRAHRPARRRTCRRPKCRRARGSARAAARARGPVRAAEPTARPGGASRFASRGCCRC